MEGGLRLGLAVTFLLICYIVSNKAHFLDKLKRKLGVLPFQGSDYSLGATASEEKVNNHAKLCTLTLCSLLEKKRDEEQLVKICCPTSLITWLKKKKIDSPSKDSDRSNCAVKIPDLRRRNQWNKMDKELKRYIGKLSKFPKVFSLYSISYFMACI